MDISQMAKEESHGQTLIPTLLMPLPTLRVHGTALGMVRMLPCKLILLRFGALIHHQVANRLLLCNDITSIVDISYGIHNLSFNFKES